MSHARAATRLAPAVLAVLALAVPGGTRPAPPELLRIAEAAIDARNDYRASQTLEVAPAFAAWFERQRPSLRLQGLADQADGLTVTSQRTDATAVHASAVLGDRAWLVADVEIRFVFAGAGEPTVSIGADTIRFAFVRVSGRWVLTDTTLLSI
ncbi:MAG TPA: hypothetical protein VF519_04265 [Mycobacteriales bacterium]|jgi:hypothetical protein